MTRHLAGLTLAIALAGGAAQPAAHEKFRIVGTVVKVQATELDVKAGRRVVVDALGHDIFDPAGC